MENDIKIITPEDWEDYELIDSGEKELLERFGSYFFVRPEPDALWKKSVDKTIWNKAHAVYQRSPMGGGRWTYRQQIPESWQISWKNLTFLIKPTGFKHMGIFPEQAAFWKIIEEKIKSAQRPISLLNLFAYTGGSSLAAASAGAAVTHLDSSKDILTWAHENARLSKLEKASIRWIPEDAITFVKREIKRGKKYDCILMDPPKFGRGVKNEVWKIEEDLAKLLELCVQLLSDKPLLFIINTYATSYSSITLGNILSQAMKNVKGKTSAGELGIKQSSNGILVPSSIFGMWAAD